jgi:hypothetical protein
MMSIHEAAGDHDRSPMAPNGLALSSRSAVRVVSPGLSPIIESHTESFNKERKCA